MIPPGPVFMTDLCRVTNSQAAAVRRRAVHQLTSLVMSTLSILKANVTSMKSRVEKETMED